MNQRFMKFAVCCLALGATAVVRAQFAVGDGSPGNPYMIALKNYKS